MARVPVELKYKNKQSKYLAWQVLYEHTPQAMIDKPKQGELWFNTVDVLKIDFLHIGR